MSITRINEKGEDILDILGEIRDYLKKLAEDEDEKDLGINIKE